MTTYSRSTRSIRPAASILLLAAFGITAVTACESGSYSGGSPLQGSGGASPGSNAALDGGVCPVPESSADGGLVPYDGYASGTVTAPGLRAQFCNARVEAIKYTYTKPGLLVQLGIDTTSLATTSRVDAPSGAVSPSINVSIGINDFAPGVYTSTDSSACGQVSFSYGTLPTPYVDCNVDVINSYQCPTGCTLTSFCGPVPDAGPYDYHQCCVPLAKTFVYEATPPGRCQGQTQQGTSSNAPGIGAWTLTLTSVTPFTGDAGNEASYGTLYMVHGTLSASLQGYVDTTDVADLSLSF